MKRLQVVQRKSPENQAARVDYFVHDRDDLLVALPAQRAAASDDRTDMPRCGSLVADAKHG